MQLASDLFEEAIDWLKHDYHSYRFFMERDIVWTIHPANCNGPSPFPLWRVLADYRGGTAQ